MTSSTRALALSGVHVGMDLQHLGDLVADPHHRVERRHRLLEDHRHGLAAQRAHLLVRRAEHVDALEQHTGPPPDRACRAAAAP
jgi:hypothetical protein